MNLSYTLLSIYVQEGKIKNVDKITRILKEIERKGRLSVKEFVRLCKEVYNGPIPYEEALYLISLVQFDSRWVRLLDTRR